MENQSELRAHLLELLEGKSAHIALKSALSDFPVKHINTRVENSPHTAWELLEHIRIAQWDILDFCKNPDYKEMKWPDDYWPREQGIQKDWKKSVQRVLDDLQSIRDLVSDEKTDLYAKISKGTARTVLREALLVVDHNAYHLGQIMLIRRILDK
jgi:hypothetical protein